MTREMKAFRWLLAGALAVQFLLQAWFAVSHSSAFDEPFFVSAGLTLCTTGRDAVLIDQPPLAKRIYGTMALLAGARAEPKARDYMGAWTLYQLNRDRAVRILMYCRMAAIAFGLALTFAAAWWAFELAGPAAGALAAWFLALEPNTLAHGSLATADVLLSLFLVLFARALWRLLAGAGGRWAFVSVGLWAGLALSTKYSAVGYVPALALACTAAALALPRKHRADPPPLQAVVKTVVTALAVIWAAFAVHFRFWDPGFGGAGPLSWLPLGLAGAPAGDFIAGISRVFSWVNVDNPVFFLGSLHGGRLPGYFPMAIALKAPLGLLAAAAVALAFRFLGPRKAALAPALLPALCLAFVLATAAMSRMHAGLRHVHIALPLLAVLAAGLAGKGLAWPKVRASLAGLALLWCAAGTARCAPHFLAHFNELAGGPGGGWRLLADSNLDWGQDLPALAEWCRENGVKELPMEYFGNSDPAWWGVPAVPFRDPGSPGFRPAIVAVSVSAIDGTLSHDLSRFDWCRNMEPLARPGWSFHIYDLRINSLKGNDPLPPFK